MKKIRIPARVVLSVLITLGALAVAAAHIAFPSIKIDAITSFWLAVAILPWLRPVFKQINLPGGLGVEYYELEKVEKQAERAGLLRRESGIQYQSLISNEKLAYVEIDVEDPQLVLAGIRLELEKRLQLLTRQKKLTAEQVSAAREFSGLLKAAIKQPDLKKDLAEQMLLSGAEIVQNLEARLGPPVQLELS